MKLTRILAALFVALSLPSMALAATGQGKVSSVKGTASETKDGVPTELKADSVVGQGDGIVTGSGSALELQLSGGATLVLGPNTSIKIKSLQDSDVAGGYSYEVILLRGTLSGNAVGAAGGSNLTVRTTAGVANVAGSRFALDFVPTSLTTGNLTAVSAAGPISVLPTNGLEPVSIPAGGQALIGPTIQNPQATIAAPSAIARANGTAPLQAGQFGYTPSINQPPIVLPANPGIRFTPPPAFSSAPQIPNLGQVTIYPTNIPNSTVPISSDGSGSVN